MLYRFLQIDDFVCRQVGSLFGISVFEQQIFDGVETAQVLGWVFCRFGFIDTSFDRIPVPVFDDLVDTVLVQRPAVHTGVERFQVCRTEKEGFALLPIDTGITPFGASLFQRIVVRAGGESVYGLLQLVHIVDHCLIGRKCHFVYEGFHNRIHLCIRQLFAGIRTLVYRFDCPTSYGRFCFSVIRIIVVAACGQETQTASHQH